MRRPTARKPKLHFGVVLLAIAMVVVLISPRPASSHLPEVTRINGSVVASRWNFSGFPVKWNLNPNPGLNIQVQGSNTVDVVIQAAFDTWTSAPNATIPVTRGADSGVTSESASPANINLICFVCMGGDFTKDSQTLAVTITTTVTRGSGDGHGGTAAFDGQIIKADILFNPTTKYTTSGTAFVNSNNETVEDLQTVATHEIGHFLGLDHSGVVKAVMFPFAPPSEHTLSYDDDAGISTLYPKGIMDVQTASISGRVTGFGSNAPIFGAHVFAGSTTDAQPFTSLRKSPISTLTKPDGTYVIQGVPADSYVVTAEPLDGPESTGDVASYSSAYGAAIQTNFTTRWH